MLSLIFAQSSRNSLCASGGIPGSAFDSFFQSKRSARMYVSSRSTVTSSRSPTMFWIIARTFFAGDMALTAEYFAQPQRAMHSLNSS